MSVRQQSLPAVLANALRDEALERAAKYLEDQMVEEFRESIRERIKEAMSNITVPVVESWEDLKTMQTSLRIEFKWDGDEPETLRESGL